MTKQTNVKYTGAIEDYFSILSNARNEWPSDEINCAVSRANAVIALVMIFLSSKESRPLDSTLSDAIVNGNVKLTH